MLDEVGVFAPCQDALALCPLSTAPGTGSAACTTTNHAQRSLSESNCSREPQQRLRYNASWRVHGDYVAHRAAGQYVVQVSVSRKHGFNSTLGPDWDSHPGWPWGKLRCVLRGGGGWSWNRWLKGHRPGVRSPTKRTGYRCRTCLVCYCNYLYLKNDCHKESTTTTYSAGDINAEQGICVFSYGVMKAG